MKPPLACKWCRKNKRKCDRAYPICSVCLKASRRCVYPVVNPTVGAGAVTQTVKRTSAVIAAQFLDYDLFQASAHGLLYPVIPVPQGLLQVIGNVDETQRRVEDYLRCIDPWYPLIPRRFMLAFAEEQAAGRLEANDILLLACIGILSDMLPDDDPCTKQYLAIKAVRDNVQSFGPLTLKVLQASALLLLYEFSHGIYPAAYISLGTYMRCLSVFGADQDGFTDVSGQDWMYLEQQRRLWWVGFIIDRAMTLGRPQQPLLIPTPETSKILPSDAESWMQERPLENSILTLSSPPTPHMGSFRLCVHASFLLDKALQYSADRNNRVARIPDESHAQQLHRTLAAFLNVLEEEGRDRVSIGVARSTTYSAIIILNSSLTPGMPLPSTTTSSPSAIAASIPLTPQGLSSATFFLSRARLYVSGLLAETDETAPFLLHWGYCTFKFFWSRCREERSERNLKSLRDLETAFHVLNLRWKLSGIYMDLASASQT